MASKAEYESVFGEDMQVLNFPAGTRGDVMKYAAEARRRIVRSRDKFTKEISALWKKRFAEIKKENDDLQLSLIESFHEAHKNIGDITRDKFEGLRR